MPLVLPVTVPPAAGTVQMALSGRTDAISMTFNGASIGIMPAQVRAGQYVVQATLQGSADPRYVQTVTVTYTVNPPAGGEHALSVNPAFLIFSLPQGTTATQLLVATPPTWTSAWDPPQLTNVDAMLSLGALATDQYQLSVNTFNAMAGLHTGSVLFSAGPAGGTQSVPIDVYVASTFYPVAGSFAVPLNAASTAADLQLSSQIVTVDGVQNHWTASTNAPWLTVLQASGVTGVNPLNLRIDPTVGGATDWNLGATVNLAIDRPGTLPVALPVSVFNYLPQLQRSNAVLVGNAGRIYVQGALNGTYDQLLSSGALHVAGANLLSAHYVTDTRFVGDMVTGVAVDVSGAVAGQPITINAVTPLASSQVTIAVKAPVQVPQGYLSLPYGNHRPSAYASGMDAFYFSGPDTIYRWAQAGGAWTLSQATVPGVIGVALRPDEKGLYAIVGATVEGLDPVNLTPLATGQLRDFTGQPTLQFDGAGPAGTASFVYASDGRAIASVTVLPGIQMAGYGAYWITSPSPTRVLADLTSAPTIGDPGQPWSNAQAGVSLARSPSGHTIAGTDPVGGAVELYQPSLAYWSPAGQVPAGLYIVAVSDDGQRMVRSDGQVLGAGADLGNLSSVVPFTHSAGGYGLTQDGRYGVVYGYQIVIENAAQRARSPTLWVVDLSQVPTTPLASAPIVATIALADAVGCTTTPLATGETCTHNASVTLSPGSGSAFVLGPRGLAAVSLPTSVMVMTASGQLQAQAQPRFPQAPKPVSRPIARPVGSLSAP